MNKRQRLPVSPDDSFCGILVTFSRLQNEINIQFSGYYPFFKRYASLSEEIREALLTKDSVTSTHLFRLFSSKLPTTRWLPTDFSFSSLIRIEQSRIKLWPPKNMWYYSALIFIDWLVKGKCNFFARLMEISHATISTKCGSSNNTKSWHWKQL